MRSGLRGGLLAGLLCLIGGQGAGASEMTERDYFSELPVVLTVSRLAQPLSETPGAVTVIDRDKIRRSGARELADVLRLVPGYLVGGFNGANPVAAYHAPLDEFGVRNLVLIDGRPIYSTYYFGGTSRGMMGLLLEDVERIEVLRGSNSAAYGANAMLGIINIITRHAGDTHGAEIALAGGEGGIRDSMARIGWGGESASFRLSTGRRGDSGYGNAHDDKIVSQAHFRGDLRLAVDQEMMVTAGVTQISAGDGYSGSPGNALRTIGWQDLFLHGQWRKQLSETDEIKLTANFDEETVGDAFPYGPDPSVTISINGRGRRANLEFQHQVGISPALRGVWGAGYKLEQAQSQALYARDDPVSFHEERLFGTLEWRPHPMWLINAGGFLGSHSRVGNYLSPRLMANFHVTPDHTVRAGVTEASRMPTLFELASDVRYYPKNLAGPFAAYAFFNIPVRTYAASGNVGPEKLFSQEVGYFGNFRDWRLTLDVRGYIETLKSLISEGVRTIPGYVNPITQAPLPVADFVNGPGAKIRGVEYQLRWKPMDETEIWLNQTFQSLLWDNDQEDKSINLPPTRATMIALFQKLPFNLGLSVMYHTMGAMTWGKDDDALPRRHRLDARLAWPFRIGATRAEAAFAVQAADGNHPEYLLRKNLVFERRAFGTLRLEF